MDFGKPKWGVAPGRLQFSVKSQTETSEENLETLLERIVPSDAKRDRLLSKKRSERIVSLCPLGSVRVQLPVRASHTLTNLSWEPVRTMVPPSLDTFNVVIPTRCPIIPRTTLPGFTPQIIKRVVFGPRAQALRVWDESKHHNWPSMSSKPVQALSGME